MPDTLSIQLPSTADLPEEVRNDQRTLRDALAAGLYRQGSITPEQARGLMGVSRREFEDRLAALGFPAMEESELHREVEAIDLLTRPHHP